MPWPVPPSSSLLPATLIAITIALATLTLFVAAIIIPCTLLSFVIARCRGQVVVAALSPATTRL
jgi:hypothetical protein